MDFSRLPKTAFLKIFEYLELEDYFRACRVNKMFRQIGQLAISHTKYLDLGEHRFRNLTSDQLAIILDLCSSNLEMINIGRGFKFGQYRQLAITFANYECPRMVDIDLGGTPIDQAVFEQLIQNCPNMESLEWQREFVGYPAMTNNRLKKLRLINTSDASLQTLIGRCPNLEDLDLSVVYGNNDITAIVLDQFFASIPHVQRIRIILGQMVEFRFEEAQMANFYNLHLTKLRISIHFDDSPGDVLLSKVATSFPHLQELRLGNYLKPTNRGIASLGVLQELQVMHLKLCGFGCSRYDQGIHQLAHCQKLRKLNVHWSMISGGNLVNLLRSCSQLERLTVWNITEVDSPQEAVVILESLTGMPMRDITIRFNGKNVPFRSIWKGEPAKAAIKKLEENDGLKIQFI